MVQFMEAAKRAIATHCSTQADREHQVLQILPLKLDRCSQNLRTNEAKNWKKERTASLNSKFTGFYKQRVYLVLPSENPAVNIEETNV